MICYGHEKKKILTGIMKKQHSKPFKTHSGFCGYPLLAQTYATQHLQTGARMAGISPRYER